MQQLSLSASTSASSSSSAAAASTTATGANNTSNTDSKEGGAAAQEIRCLIDNHSVGCIIGKGGANVKRVRDETGVSISILKAENVKAVKERVMLLKGSTPSLSKAL